MKKLMIAAAVAAMICGAEAADYEFVYDFTASVKSTGAKSSKAKTYTVKLGWNDARTMTWWQALAESEEEAQELIKDAKAAYEEDPTDTTLSGILDTLGWDGTKTAFPKKDPILKDYCLRFQFTEKPVCYRVAKSYKFKDTFVTDCCGDKWASYYETDSELTQDFLHKFNAASYNGANKVEIKGSLAAETAFNRAFGLTGDDDASNVAADFAGQGSWKALKVASDWYETYADGISGNIVGTWAGATCPDCCSKPGIPSIAFECGDLEAAKDLETAFFGTFTMKLNKSATKAVNDTEEE